MKAPQTKQPHGNNENAGVSMIIPRLPVQVHSAVRYNFIGQTSVDASEEYKERVSAQK